MGPTGNVIDEILARSVRGGYSSGERMRSVGDWLGRDVALYIKERIACLPH
jgi:hypothetical protein